MEIRQFRYFIKIADLGSVSKASRALHIAQPALSQQISQLEAELGQALFSRHSGGMQMTEPGEVFYRHAQRMLKQLADIPTAVRQSAAQPAGNVAVGLPQSTASHYALPLLETVPARFPDVTIEFFDEISGHLLHGLLSGKLDLAVIVSDLDAAMLDATPLMDESLFLISRSDQAPAQRSISLKRLVQLPLALPGLAHGVRAQVEQAVHAAKLELPSPCIVANSMSIMRDALHRGLAHSVMPWGAVAAEVKAGLFKATPISPALRRRVYVCTAPDMPLSLASQAIRDCLLAQTRQRVRDGLWQGVQLV
jgi:LysR family nitrogen assimilation transcriptional regulator